MSLRTMIAAALGATAALGTDVATRRIVPSRRREAWALGLVGAAAIYPLARRGSAGTAGEMAVLAAAGCLVGPAIARPEPRGRAIVAAGWLAHAGFDAAFHANDASRIPRWYPAMCAGYDVAAAALLLARP